MVEAVQPPSRSPLPVILHETPAAHTNFKSLDAVLTELEFLERPDPTFAGLLAHIETRLRRFRQVPLPPSLLPSSDPFTPPHMPRSSLGPARDS